MRVRIGDGPNPPGDLAYVNNVLSLSSLCSIAAFVGYVLVTGA
ncbi:MAG: hypothetical protein U0R79_08195 [Propionicimonas sp.]